MARDLSQSRATLVLQRSLRNALRKRNHALQDLDPDPVHDVRVALRRCRSLAEAFAALDSHPVWKKLLKACKKQQRGLSDLRDIQVMRGWLHTLDLASTSAGASLADELKDEEIVARKRAKASLKAFPRKRWKRWLDRLPARTQRIHADDERLAQIALECIVRVRRLDRRWHREHIMSTWHRLRVGVKGFRYIVESFLPEQHAVWEKDLRRLQDLLGEGHDLDVLRVKILHVTNEQPVPKKALNTALRRIDGAIAKRVEAYEQIVRINRATGTLGTRRPKRHTRQTLWDRWRLALAGVAG